MLTQKNQVKGERKWITGQEKKKEKERKHGYLVSTPFDQWKTRLKHRNEVITVIAFVFTDTYEKWSVKEDQIRIIKFLDTILGCFLNQGFEAVRIINDSEHTMLMLISVLICRFVEQLNNGGMLNEFDGYPYLLHQFFLFAHKHRNIPFANFFHCSLLFTLLFTLPHLVFIHVDAVDADTCVAEIQLNNKSFWVQLASSMACSSHNLMFINNRYRMYKK